MTDPRHGVRKGLGAFALGVVVLGAAVPACSSKTGVPSSSASSSTAAAAAVTVMVEGHSHAISGGIQCRTAPAETNATPPESGTQTTRIEAHDESASVTLSISDLTPPDVNSFAISLKAGGTNYQMPYQPVQSATQVQASRDGKKYTVTGTGQGETGPNTMRQLPFGIHVTCP
jgi:hypothetical protein